jgi:cytochrome c biogenesis protein CcdA
MILSLLAYLGGVLMIVSPCILPVLPFVFAKADRPFPRSGLPLLAGMAATSAVVATHARGDRRRRGSSILTCRRMLSPSAELGDERC